MWRHGKSIHLNLAYGVSTKNQYSKPVECLVNPVYGQDSENVVAKVQPCGIAWEIRGQHRQIAGTAGNYITGTKAVGRASGHRGRKAKTQGEQKGCSYRVTTAASNIGPAQRL